MNGLYYIYKERCDEEKNGLDIGNANKFDYTKLRLTDDYQYESEEGEENQTDKNPDKKEPPKKTTKNDVKKINKLIIKEETGMNRKLFQKILGFKCLMKC